MAIENMLTDKQSEEILLKNYNKINRDGIPMKSARFKMEEGVHQKVTLVSNVSGLFKNIAFIKGVENTINGNIADDLLDLFPTHFSVIKINGVLVSKGKEDKFKNMIRQEIIDELKDNYKLTPIVKDTKRTEHDKKEVSKPIKEITKQTNKYTKVE